MANFENMSDEELFQLAGISPQASASNFSTMSDDELFQMAGIQPETAGDRAIGLIGSIGQGATLGGLDEAAAGLRSIIPDSVATAIRGRPFQDYDSELAAIRGGQEQFDAAHPYISTAASIAGGVAMPGGLYRKGGNLLAKGALLAGEGAAYGGAYGFGSGEGGLENRLESAQNAAEVGAIAAPAIVGTLGAARSAVAIPGKVYNALAPAARQGQAEEAARMVVRQMATDPEAAAATLGKFNAARPAKPAATDLAQFKRAAEITGDTGLSKFEEAIRRVSDDVDANIQGQGAAREGVRQNIIDRVTPDLNEGEAGAAVRSGLEANLERAKANVSELADKAFKGGEELRTFPAKAAVSNTLHTFTKDGSRSVSGEFQKLVDNFRGLPPRTDLKTLQNYRSAFGNFSKPGIGATTIDKQTASIANSMRKALDNSVDKAISEGELSKAQGNAWRKMIAASADQKNTFESGVVKGVLRKEGPNLYKTPDSKVPFKALDTPESARAMMKALGPHIPGKEGMRAALLNHIVEKSAPEGKFLPAKFARQLRSVKTVAPEILTKAQQNALAKVGEDLSSEAGIKARAFGASKGNSITAQSTAAIDAIRGSISGKTSEAISFVSPRLGAVLKIAQKVLAPDDLETLVNQELAKFVLDPKYAEGMLTAVSTKAGRSTLSAFADHLQSAAPRLLGQASGENAAEEEKKTARKRENLFAGSLPAPKQKTFAPAGNVPDSPRVLSIRRIGEAQDTAGSYMPKLKKQELAAVASQAGVPENDHPLMLALAGAESGKKNKAGEILYYDSDAVSPKGAQGLMQLMPAIQKAFAVKDPFAPVENMRGAYELVKEERARFGTDPKLIAAAYNAGSPAVRRAIKKAGSRDYADIAKFLPKETREYVKQIVRTLSA